MRAIRRSSGDMLAHSRMRRRARRRCCSSSDCIRSAKASHERLSAIGQVFHSGAKGARTACWCSSRSSQAGWNSVESRGRSKGAPAARWAQSSPGAGTGRSGRGSASSAGAGGRSCAAAGMSPGAGRCCQEWWNGWRPEWRWPSGEKGKGAASDRPGSRAVIRARARDGLIATCMKGTDQRDGADREVCMRPLRRWAAKPLSV